MRAYYFGNMYLSSIQQGIQAAHVTAELFSQYPRYKDQEDIEKQEMLYEWAQNHKVMILLNAGYGEELHTLRQTFMIPDNPYPWAAFAESPEALDGALTSVGIILPEKIYLTAAAIREDRSGDIRREIQDNGTLSIAPGELFNTEDHGEIIEFSKWEFDFMNRLNRYGLAR